MVTKAVGPLRLASVAARMVLAVPIGVTRALAVALSTVVLATTLTAFSPLLNVMPDRRRRARGGRRRQRWPLPGRDEVMARWS